MMVKKAKPLAIECVVPVTWPVPVGEPASQTVCDVNFRPVLRNLSCPSRSLPGYKAETGHDENISFEQPLISSVKRLPRRFAAFEDLYCAGLRPKK